MWYKKVYSTIFVSMVILTIVKASCLEYGHSCWGAHGKRSEGRVYRPALAENLNVATMTQNKPMMESPDENGGLLDGLDIADDVKIEGLTDSDDGKLRKLLRSRNFRFQQRTPLESESQEQRDFPAIQLQQELKDGEDKWRKLPLFNLRNKNNNNNNNNNGLWQQLERRRLAADDRIYYDQK